MKVFMLKTNKHDWCKTLLTVIPVYSGPQADISTLINHPLNHCINTKFV